MRAKIESADVGAVSIRRMGASTMSEEDEQGRLDRACIWAPNPHQASYATKVATRTYNDQKENSVAHLSRNIPCLPDNASDHKIVPEGTANRRGSSV